MIPWVSVGAGGLTVQLVTSPAVSACPDCKGDGVIYIPHCKRGRDHAGRDCGGAICDSLEVECEGCGGSGEVGDE